MARPRKPRLAIDFSRESLHAISPMNMHRSIHPERHYSSRNNWLRAGVLGANDGLISTSALLMGLTGASTGRGALVIAGLSALVAGALSMAAGEFVSVSSQADTERADLDKERRELDRNPEAELDELASIYENRGLDPALAREVAVALTRHNDLEAHARDEIGLSETIETNPLQAAWASALSFICGAILPVLVVFAAPNHMLLPALCGSTLTGLAGLGWLSAHLGGAPGGRAVLRMLIWGVIALGVSYLAGEKAEGIFN